MKSIKIKVYYANFIFTKYCYIFLECLKNNSLYFIFEITLLI